MVELTSTDEPITIQFHFPEVVYLPDKCWAGLAVARRPVMSNTISQWDSG
jgi:hypothetical protein